MDKRELGIKVLSPLAFTIALFVVWEIICKALDVPLTILPAPSDVFGALWQYRAPIADNSLRSAAPKPFPRCCSAVIRSST